MYKKIIFLFAPLLMLYFVSNVRAKNLTISLNNVKTISFKKSIGFVVVGNPSIANATIADEKLLVLFPTGIGQTNIIVLDERHRKIDEYIVSVFSSVPGRMTYYAGEKKRTYRCLPKCQPISVIGDDKAYFLNINDQIKTRFSTSSSVSGDNSEHSYKRTYLKKETKQSKQITKDKAKKEVIPLPNNASSLFPSREYKNINKAYNN